MLDAAARKMLHAPLSIGALISGITMNRVNGCPGMASDSSRTLPTVASSSASRENQPTVSKHRANGMIPSVLTAPGEVRMPYTPQSLAGTRTDPAVSVPSAKSTTPAATAAADPDDDPPGTRLGASVFRGVP